MRAVRAVARFVRDVAVEVLPLLGAVAVAAAAVVTAIERPDLVAALLLGGLVTGQVVWVYVRVGRVVRRIVRDSPVPADTCRGDDLDPPAFLKGRRP